MSGRDPAQSIALLEALDSLAALEGHIRFETGQLRAGKLREGLAAQESKTAAANRYLASLARIAAEGALAQGSREIASELGQRHRHFQALLEENLAALTMARGVSESILRELSLSLVPKGPKLYGPATRAPVPSPLAVSRST